LTAAGLDDSIPSTSEHTRAGSGEDSCHPYPNALTSRERGKVGGGTKTAGAVVLEPVAPGGERPLPMTKEAFA